MIASDLDTCLRRAEANCRLPYFDPKFNTRAADSDGGGRTSPFVQRRMPSISIRSHTARGAGYGTGVLGVLRSWMQPSSVIRLRTSSAISLSAVGHRRRRMVLLLTAIGEDVRRLWPGPLSCDVDAASLKFRTRIAAPCCASRPLLRGDSTARRPRSSSAGSAALIVPRRWSSPLVQRPGRKCSDKYPASRVRATTGVRSLPRQESYVGVGAGVGVAGRCHGVGDWCRGRRESV